MVLGCVRRTFEELSAVDLAGGDLEGDDMALQEDESQHGGSRI